jgi:hypothetical protein
MRKYSTFQQTGKTGDKTIEKIGYFDWQAVWTVISDLQQQCVIATSYHKIPTDFMRSEQWVEVDVINYPKFWLSATGRLGHDTS